MKIDHNPHSKLMAVTGANGRQILLNAEERKALLKHLLDASPVEQRRLICWQLLKEIDETQRVEDEMGTDRLVRVLHDRPAQARDYLGGGNARMLYEAADTITRQRWQIADLERRGEGVQS